MKKAFLLITALLILSFQSFSQNTADKAKSLEEARQSSTKAVEFFKQKKYAEALPEAQKASAIYERELGAENVEVARAQRNLGYIYYYLDNQKETQKAFEKSLAIYEKQTNLNNAEGLNMAGMLETLAVIKYSDDKNKTVQELLEKMVAVYEKYGQSDSLKTSQAWFGLANLRTSGENYTGAAQAYEKALAIRMQKLGRKDFETKDAFNRCMCAYKKADKEAEVERVKNAYFPGAEISNAGSLYEKQEKEEEKKVEIPNDGKTIVGIPLNEYINKGELNGRAISLSKPAYPAEARAARASGTVNVSVTIDEEGKVLFACGAFNEKIHPALRLASEAAAYRSKFEPTMLNGKPIKVFGVVVYKFAI